jgi:molybdopterin-guanine dinucleotide biosynthesis protein A
MVTVDFDAIVLTGGRGSRLGGVAKADVRVAGRPLLDRARDAVAQARSTIVVGPEVSGGPVAGIAAGLLEVRADVVVLLACDMPLVSPNTVSRLTGALAGAADCDGALLTDDRGRRQYLAAAYRTASLRIALSALDSPAGQSMRRLVEGLHVREVAAHPDEAMDCDTWPDVDRAIRLLEER